MALHLYMVGVIVDDMAKSVEFYRRLGLEIPEGSETEPHVRVEMNELTFFLHARKMNQLWDPGNSPASGGYPIVLEFYLETREAVDAKFNELVAFGYKAHLEPYDTPINTYFAMIDDPDGNSVLLSGGEGA
ncbi:putative quinone binding protein [hydrothermal vent metagenome]|uniref:Putative quinone binding protein n=1 Tax=hydrothermal vent metagenome TaxID=652676 RepID=A0A3B0RFM0_9ZZZZ